MKYIPIWRTWGHFSTSRSDSLTHWGRVTHMCVSNLTINGSENGLSPERRQAIIWTNAGILLIGPLATNFSEILIEIHAFSFKKMHLKMSSAKWRQFCLGLNVLNTFSENIKRFLEIVTMVMYYTHHINWGNIMTSCIIDNGLWQTSQWQK